MLPKVHWKSCSILRTNSHKWSVMLVSMITTLLTSFVLSTCLPIRSRMSFSVATMCFKALRSELPDYLYDVLHLYVPTCILRSSDMQLLTAPNSKMKSATRRFSCIDPTAWNSLPLNIRNCDNISTFKTPLKTYLIHHDLDITWLVVEPMLLSHLV